MANILYLWRETREIGFSESEIQRQLDAGNDIDGLADLGIKQMISQLKAGFPAAKETAGLLYWQKDEQRWQATWSWQFLRIESHNLTEEHRDQFLDLARSFNCLVYDSPMNLRILP